jgi:hypothetical protein
MPNIGRGVNIRNFLSPFSVYVDVEEIKMSNHHREGHVPWFLWPFWAIWRLVILIIEFTGRLVGAILGLVLLIVGVVLTVTIVGAIVGIPMIIFGFLLMIRSLF